MKTKTLKWLSLIVIVVLSAGFASCEDDSSSDSDSDNPSGLVATLQANKWVNRDVSDWNDTSYGGYFETSSRTFYFMDDNVGYVYEQYKDYDSSLGTNRSSYFGKFSYTVSGKTVTIRYADTGNTATYKYSGGYLVSSDSYYEPTKMTSSDYSFVNEKAENLEYEQNIYKYVEVTDEFDEENITVNITIETELSEKYPKETFKYAIEWGFGYFEDISYFDLDGTSLLIKVPVLDLTVDGYTSMRTYTLLQEKVAKGEKLSTDEKNLLNDCIEIINDELKKFQARVFVEANGIKYYVEDDIYAGTIDFDPKYEPDEDNSSSGNGNSSSISGSINGHDYVDLGLSVKWATCNVGASSPEECGIPYAWGEISADYSASLYDYEHIDNSGYIFIGYDISGTRYDVAYKKWGTNWRMPTKDEMEELINNCDWTKDYYNGEPCYKATGKNGNSIYFNVYCNHEGKHPRSYWSSTLCRTNQSCAYFMSVADASSQNSIEYNRLRREDILLIRPVCD